MKSFWATSFPPSSAHLVVTSPPYWTLKEYPDTVGQMDRLCDYGFCPASTARGSAATMLSCQVGGWLRKPKRRRMPSKRHIRRRA